MKKVRISLMVAIAAAGAALTGCGGSPEFFGTWESVTPTDFTANEPGMRQTSSQVTIEFAPEANGTDGYVAITNDFAVARNMNCDSAACVVEAHGKARVEGTWAFDVDDDDDLLLTLNYPGMTVNVDTATMIVTGTGAVMLTDRQRSELKAEAAEVMKHEVGVAMSTEMRRYSVISDVKVSKDKKMLGFEISAPDADMRFRRIGE